MSKKVVGRVNSNANPGNALEVLKENCQCDGDTPAQECNYSVAVDAAIASVTVDGDTLDLPGLPYPNSAIGAAALQADLRLAIGGAAQSVTVTYDSGDDETTITITKTKAVFTLVNAVAVTQTC